MRIRGTFVYASDLSAGRHGKSRAFIARRDSDFADPVCRAISLPHRPPVDYDVYTWVHQKTKAKS
jgi:hypothetical protein